MASMQIHRCCYLLAGWPRARRRRRRPGQATSISLLLSVVLVCLQLNGASMGWPLGQQLGPRPAELAPATDEEPADRAQSASVRLTNFQVPQEARVGQQKRLSCRYEIQGATLHALKLFKDNQEFYRYTPGNQRLVFPVLGARVEVANSNGGDVMLRIDRHSAGIYKCQVSLERTFNSVSAERRLQLAGAELADQPQSQQPQQQQSSLWPHNSHRPRAGGPGRQQTVRHQQDGPASLAAYPIPHSAGTLTLRGPDNHYQQLVFVLASWLVLFLAGALTNLQPLAGHLP